MSPEEFEEWSAKRTRPVKDTGRLGEGLEVDVYVDHFDAYLRPGMAGSGAPSAVSYSGILDVREGEATPLASRRQTRGAFAGELVGKRFFLPIRVPEHVRAELAI
jgi:hypothetical protein